MNYSLLFCSYHFQNGIKNRKSQNIENQQVSAARSPSENDSDKHQSRSETPKTQQSSTSPFDTSQLTPKILTPPSSFDAFFSRPHPQFNFYTHPLLSQPLNFSSNRLPFPSMLPQSQLVPPIPTSQSPQFNKSSNIQQEARNFVDDLYKKEKMLQEKRMKPANLKKIDRIAENLRFGTNSSISPPSSSSPSSTKSFLEHFNQMSVKKESTPTPNYPNALAAQFLNDKNIQKPAMENLLNYNSPNNENGNKKASTQGNSSNITGSTPTKIPNSKLFAKCFICSKLLSNQYNLRVHLETHQNMR